MYSVLIASPRRRSPSEGLEGELERALAVGARALEPDVPGALGDLARLLHLFLGRLDDGHAQLGQTLAALLVGRRGVLPFLLLELGALPRVPHDLFHFFGPSLPPRRPVLQPLLGGPRPASV